jgi:hypothetical protein
LGIESGSGKSVWKLKYLVQILKIFIPDTNECNSILWSSGYTGIFGGTALGSSLLSGVLLY